ncbi:helix-turn-helix domain-containing protein [Salinisphaera shabanensis]|jgi:transcriptional regulator with XRE-family HTH domain|uniref:helix-turn-helix domain-containing protein n=1 Tax=Salinisphaera shabanensis TaxID=180542 RepID=UPI0012679E4F|nr:helix-turn-helix transcriptional regulator [Salinisphaera shabanensis]
MTTSLGQLINANCVDTLDSFSLAYLKESFRGDLNDQLLELLERSDLTKADVARRLGKRPEQITRWLSAPCNLESDTIVELAAAFGRLPRLVFESINSRSQRAKILEYEDDKFVLFFQSAEIPISTNSSGRARQLKSRKNTSSHITDQYYFDNSLTNFV